MDSGTEAPLSGVMQTKSLTPKDRLISPAMSTPPSLATDGSSPEIVDDKASTCSDECEEAACSDCCESDQCSPECLPSCDGFVDCDDDNFCTNVECAEDVCLDTAPPCFDTDCLQTPPNLGLQSFSRPQECFPWFHTTTTDQTFNNLLWAANTAGPSSLTGESYSLPQYSYIGTPFTTAGTVVNNGVSQSPAKRRKISSEYGQHSQQYLYGPPEQQQIIENTGGHPAQCKWVQGGEPCDTTLYGWRALDYHVQEQHIKPQTSLHCQWNHCEEDIDPSALLSHVKRKHSPARNEHVCLWQGCDAKFEDADDLDRHLKAGHVSNNQLHCEWERCGATAIDPRDLSLHLQTDHLMDPGTMSLDNPRASCDTPASVSPEIVEEHVCRWILEQGDGSNEATCGMTFQSTGHLQQHLKDSHLKAVTSKTNLVCRWQGCERGPEKPFSQKGKLERHFVTHTGRRSLLNGFTGQTTTGGLIRVQINHLSATSAYRTSPPSPPRNNTSEHILEKDLSCVTSLVAGNHSQLLLL
ncbi:zinc-finger protein [Acarospora aff. strigata]|nr:zinc-finger protein [Acarospora aff. strigata]